MVVGRDDNFNAGLLTDLYQLPAINYQLKGTQAMNTKRNLQDDLCGREARCRRERRAEMTPDPLGPVGTTTRPPEGTTTRPPKGTTGRGCGGNTGRPQGGSTQINDFQAPIQWPRHVCRGVGAWGNKKGNHENEQEQ